MITTCASVNTGQGTFSKAYHRRQSWFFADETNFYDSGGKETRLALQELRERPRRRQLRRLRSCQKYHRNSAKLMLWHWKPLDARVRPKKKRTFESKELIAG